MPIIWHPKKSRGGATGPCLGVRLSRLHEKTGISLSIRLGVDAMRDAGLTVGDRVVPGIDYAAQSIVLRRTASAEEGYRLVAAGDTKAIKAGTRAAAWFKFKDESWINYLFGHRGANGATSLEPEFVAVPGEIVLDLCTKNTSRKGDERSSS